MHDINWLSYIHDTILIPNFRPLNMRQIDITRRIWVNNIDFQIVYQKS